MMDTAFINSIYLLITPYLNERRIHLNRPKVNTKYFYTSINSDEALEKKYNDAVEEDILNRLS